jgi:cytochrome P450
MDLVVFCRDLVFHQLSTLMGGLEASDLREDFERMIHTAIEVGITKRWPRIMAYDPRFLRARARVARFGRGLVEAMQRAAPDDPRFPADGIIAINVRAARDGLLREADLWFLSLVPYIAGLDTVASSMAFLLAAVYRDLALVDRLRPEADAAFHGDIGDAAWLSRVPRIEAVLCESLRRYSVSPLSLRRCIRSFQFGGRAVREGEDVIFPFALGHFLEEYYPDPMRFDPERFFGPNAARKVPNVYSPFAVGAHACLGAALAETQLVVTLATMLSRAEVKLGAAAGRPIRTVHTPFPVPKGETILVRPRAERAPAQRAPTGDA